MQNNGVIGRCQSILWKDCKFLFILSDSSRHDGIPSIVYSNSEFVHLHLCKNSDVGCRHSSESEKVLEIHR